MKYIFFVKNGQVARVLLSKFLNQSKSYYKNAKGKSLSERRTIADELAKKLIKFS